MTFDLKEFIKENLIAGVINDTFSREYACILSVNYLTKGILAETDVEEISIKAVKPTKEPEDPEEPLTPLEPDEPIEPPVTEEEPEIPLDETESPVV